MHRVALVLIFGWLPVTAWANGTDTTLAWQPDWYIVADGQLVRAQRWHHERVGYFLPPQSANSRLIIRSRGPFSVWIGNTFFSSYPAEVVLPLDSLRARFGSGLWIGLQTRDGLNNMHFKVQVPQQQVPRPFFRHLPVRDLSNFSIVVAMLLAGYAIILWRSSPRLFLEYFNAFRVVSTRARDETQLLRITSSQNILYYFFLGGWWSFLGVLLVATDATPATPLIEPTRFADLMLNWVGAMALIVALLFAKYALQRMFAVIYAVSDFAADQFFTFVRLGFLVALGVTIWLFGSYVFQNSLAAPYPKAMVALLLFSLLSIPFMQIRCMSATSFRMFHIFSYLCITEVIPLLVTFKFLYY